MEPDPRGERQGNWNTEYGLLFEHSRDGILFTAPDGRIFDANPAACRALGRTVAELRALGRDGVIDLTDPRLPAAIAARTQGGHWVGELTFIRRDGTKFPVQLSSTLFPDHDGRPRASIIFRDVTAILEAARERSLLEAQLLQAQKMESLGILAGGMAHDMNNVLTAILGMAQASLGDHPAGSPAYAAFDTIAQAALRGGRTVRGILSFARGTAVEDRELDLNDVVREEARILERTTLEGVRVALELAPDLRPMRGDASALTHAIMNLCVNAVDAMPANGTLTLRTRNLDPGWIEVTVQDTGTGMPGDVIARALDPFFTTKEVGKGTGLGLAIVYRTVTAQRPDGDPERAGARHADHAALSRLRSGRADPGPFGRAPGHAAGASRPVRAGGRRR